MSGILRGSIVSTAAGLVPIEQVVVGDLVTTFQPTRFQQVMVTNHVISNHQPLVRISLLADPSVTLFVCAPDHRLCTRRGGSVPLSWSPAGELHGRRVWFTADEAAYEISVETIPPGDAIVHNLTVDTDGCVNVGGILVQAT